MREETEKETIIEILRELSHDLGKYMTLQIRFLPRDATDEMFRDAVLEGLRNTFHKNGHVRDARWLWESFKNRLNPLISKELLTDSDLAGLNEIIRKAIEWGDRPHEIITNRIRVREDLLAVPRAIRTTLERLEK